MGCKAQSVILVTILILGCVSNGKLYYIGKNVDFMSVLVCNLYQSCMLSM